MQLYYCDVCGQRLMKTNIAAIAVDSGGKFLCADCERVSQNRIAPSRRSSRRNRVPEEKRLWIMFAAAPVLALTFGFLARHSNAAPHPIQAPEPLSPAASLPVSAVAGTVHASQPVVMATPSLLPAIAIKPAPRSEPAGDSTDSREKPKDAPPPATPATSTENPAPAPTHSNHPEQSTASAASAGESVKTANPAEAPKVVDTQAGLDEACARAWARLLEGETQAAIRVMEALRDDQAFAPRTAEINEELALIKTYVVFLKAIPAGLNKIDPQHPYVLKKLDGKTVPLGPDAHRSIVRVKDDEIECEEKLGGASALQKCSICQLCAQTRYDLAVLGMQAGPENSLSLAYAAFVMVRTDSAVIPVTEVKSRIDAAKKDKTLADRASRLLERFVAAQTEQSMHAAMRKIETSIKPNRAQAKALLSDFKRDYVNDNPPAGAREFADRASFELSEVKQGLWASYFCGDEPNPMRKYIFSREETKLDFNWALGSPDPKVPPDFFGIRMGGLLRVTTPGTYTFKIVADDFVEMSIDGQRLLTVTWNGNGEEGKTCAVKLTAGDHDFKIVYKEYLVNALFSVKWKMDNESKWLAIPESALWYDPKLVEKYQKDSN